MERLTEIIRSIPASSCDYQEWCNVGMALKHEGYSAGDWDEWSRGDKRYHAGECFKKWESFQESAGSIVTAGTIVEMAKHYGWRPKSSGTGEALAWDATITDELEIIDNKFIESEETKEPTAAKWNPCKEILTYLETLFQADDYVGYVVKAIKKQEEGKPDKWVPANKGNYKRTAGELIESIKACRGDIGSVLGDTNDEAGAWIRFNPLDGNGVNNSNVTDLRYALVESDTVEIGSQIAVIKALQLPVAIMVNSGGKSIHAIVKINAVDMKEYRERVNYLYEVCAKNGFAIDIQNSNPSRLSRLPGIMRGGKKQYIIPGSINSGSESYEKWKEYVEGVNDDLPDVENAAEWWDSVPDLNPELIHNVLRQGDKMLVTGPSKAGKSFSMLELAIAIAEGRRWMGIQCAKGRVMYINLELHDSSCEHRIKDVYDKLGWMPDNLDNIDVWNLRGRAQPMDKLTPRLIRRAKDKNYIAIIIDPIYKVITGDENSADQMAAFCNNFDKLCQALNCAVIYCHHFSKAASEINSGTSAMNKASGSGVFARDPDAMISFTQLVDKDRDDDDKRTCWKVEGALREFEPLEPFKVWFDYPIHVRVEPEKAASIVDYKDANREGRTLVQQTEDAYYYLLDDPFEGVRAEDMGAWFDIGRTSIYQRIKKDKNLVVENGNVKIKLKQKK